MSAPKYTPRYPVSLGASHNLVERITDVLANAASTERLMDREWRPVLLALKDARDVLAAPADLSTTAKQRDELLALLKRWYSWCNDGVQPISVRTQIESETRAAIAKAEGGAS